MTAWPWPIILLPLPLILSIKVPTHMSNVEIAPMVERKVFPALSPRC